MRNIPPDPPVSLTVSMPLERQQAEDPTAGLIESLRPELVRFAYWLSRDRALAEDVVQEALLRAWRAREALRDRSAARAWLLRIVRREHARLYERKRLETTNLQDAIAAEDGALAACGSELLDLKLAILKLPEEYRIPLVMQVLGGFSCQEIAQELELSSTAVLSRLFRARNKLRTLYGLTPAPEDSVEGSP
ncbi:MAG TPA: sigma-70 family RNA polymerase sigma factor [Steroidobacteraceae bacterium]|nr:sigma-70 family RNA polymerase sigma factor [Steroidobacteraceae bacterium]